MGLAAHVVLQVSDLQVLSDSLGMPYEQVRERYAEMLLRSDTLNVFGLLLDPESRPEVMEFAEKLETLRKKPESESF